VSASARVGLVLAAVVVAVVLFLVLREGDEEAADPQGAAATAAVTDPAATDSPLTSGATGDTSGETTGETTPPATTQAAPDEVRARIAIGPDGPTGVQRIVARRGQRVVLAVQSQIADHVHVHGYDLFADVGPGTPATIRFRANIPGRFEIELEDRHVQIAQLRVDP